MNARPLWYFLVPLALLISLSACSKKDAPAPDAAQNNTAFQAANNSIPAAPAPPAAKKPPARPSPDAIAWGDEGLVVMLSEVERASKQGVLFTTDEGLLAAGAVPDSLLSKPYIQLSITRGLVSMKLLEIEAKRRGLTPTPEQVEAFIASHPTLSRFASEPFKLTDGTPLPNSWDHYGVTRDDLIVVGTGLLTQERVREALLADIAKQDHWESYRLAHTLRRLIIAHSPNVPTSAEIDDLIARDAAQAKSSIEEYFQKNKRRFLIPRTVKLTMLSAPYGAEIEPWRKALTDAEARLKAGEDPAAIADALKLKLEPDVAIVRQENAAAFQGKIGDIGHTENGPRGIYTWRVESISESKEPTLDRPLRREIAAELLQYQLTANAKKLHDELRADLSALTITPSGDPDPAQLQALRDKYKDREVTFLVTEPFPHAADGFIPGAGLVEPLVDATFKKLSTEAPTTARPIVSRQRVYEARLLDSEEASKDAFEAERAAWTKKTQELRAPTILESTIGELRAELQVEVDLGPIRDKYGREEKGAPNTSADPAEPAQPSAP
jgi:hypothetical protein